MQRERYLARRGRRTPLLNEVVPSRAASQGGHPPAAAPAAQPRVAPARAARAGRPRRGRRGPRSPRPRATSARSSGIPSSPSSRSPDSGGHVGITPMSTSTCGRSAPPPSPASWRPFGAPAAPGPHDDPPGRLAQAPDPRPHLRRVDRRPARLPRTGPGRPLRPHDPGLLPLHPLRRRCRDHVGRPPSRLGQGPETGRHRHPPRPPAPADAPGRPGQRNGSEF